MVSKPLILKMSTSEDTGSKQSLINTAGNKGTANREGEASTQRVQSDAELETPHGTKQPQYLYVGQWLAKTRPGSPALATPSIILEPIAAVRTTGTTALQNEEETIGTVDTRTPTDDSTHSEHQNEPEEVSWPHDTPPTEDLKLSNDGGPNLPCDYYQFEWFCILIGMVFLMISEIMIFVLAVYHEIIGSSEEIKWLNIIILGGIGLLPPLLYTGAFVLLMEYHETIGNLLDRFACVPFRPWLQRIGLRIFAYGYVCVILAGYGYLLYHFTYKHPM